MLTAKWIAYYQLRYAAFFNLFCRVMITGCRYLSIFHWCFSWQFFWSKATILHDKCSGLNQSHILVNLSLFKITSDNNPLYSRPLYKPKQIHQYGVWVPEVKRFWDSLTYSWEKQGVANARNFGIHCSIYLQFFHKSCNKFLEFVLDYCGGNGIHFVDKI